MYDTFCKIYTKIRKINDKRKKNAKNKYKYVKNG